LRPGEFARIRVLEQRLVLALGCIRAYLVGESTSSQDIWVGNLIIKYRKYRYKVWYIKIGDSASCGFGDKINDLGQEFCLGDDFHGT
jgi:hypothetical protein